MDYNKEVDRLYKKAFPIDYERDKQLERDALQFKKYQGKLRLKNIFDLGD